MSNIRKKDGDSEGDSGFVTPDSTTREKVGRFSEGEDVLSHGKDGIYYLGTIVLVDLENDRTLVQFEDRTARWSLLKDITKLRIPDSDELCVICKSSKSSCTNEIILCHICDQGYHQKCFQPNISNEFCEVDSEWECPQCVSKSLLQKEVDKKSRENSPRKHRIKQLQPEEGYKISLPYKLDCLNWDIGHKRNKEQTYCYCGGPGEWYNRMLQCERCKQWFHEACVDCLHISLLYGDRFYAFVCSLCNDGNEFLYRLDLKWVDVVHLATFNLTMQESKMYFDYDAGINRWITDNWEYLQCPFELQNMKVDERKTEVLKILELNQTRFKCGRECRKKSSVYALRTRVAPPIPSIELPSNEVITELSINKFIYREKTCHSPPIPRHHKFREDRLEDVENILSRFSPAKKRIFSATSIQNLSGNEEYDQERPVVMEDEDKMQSRKKKRKRELDILMEDKKAKKMIEDICLNGVLQSSRLCTQNIVVVAPPATTEVEDNVKRKRGRPPKNAPLKRTSSGKLLRELHHRRSHNLARDVYKEIKDEDKKDHFTAAGDTSGDDTSSHGTLDSFIPPPSNFEGPNNPFLNLESNCYTMPVARLLKRQLSESDIKIGKNGEIKRRRFRRKLDKSKYIYNYSSVANNGPGTGTNNNSITTPINMNNVNIDPPSSSPIMGANIRNCVEYALNGRLHQSQVENGKQDAPQYSLSDLKSSVNTYFGAVNRIANGEKFHILAKRISFENRVQFLIEWESPPNT